MPNARIVDWSDTDTTSPLALLQDAHFKTFNAAESQTARRAQSQYLHGLRILESAFNYLLAMRDADEELQRVLDQIVGAMAEG